MLGFHRTPLNLTHPHWARASSPRHRVCRRDRRAWTVEWLEGRTLLSGAQPLTFSVNLQTGVGDAAVPPYITYQSPIRDANGDGWYEAVLKLTLDGSPYNQAMFQVQYTATPTGEANVNIGDSRTDDTGSGDAATQSNDAEISVGRGGGVPTTFWAWGRDGTPTPGEELAQAPNFAANGVTATFVVRNNFASWDNGQGVSGSLDSPYLFALAGQPDAEGPVNYDIYAGFNKVVAGDYRFGTGVGQVTVTLSNTADNTPVLNDAGFESPALGAGNHQYAPAGSPWSFAGPAGISGNGSGFTAGNPAAPEGGQVAFLQGTGSMSQAVSGWAAGSYVVSFDAAQRGNWQDSAQDFEILVDGQVVGTFIPTDTTYRAYATAVFPVTAGSHTLTFKGLDTAGGDNTAFIDGVTISQLGLADAGFEQVAVGAGNYQYRPAGSPWSFAGPAGVSGNGSGFTAGNPAAPEGGQVAFLQRTGSMSQAVSVQAGTYMVSFSAAQRGNWQDSAQDFEVLVDGQVVGTFTPADMSYRVYATAAFPVTEGAHTITFKGLDSAGGDNTAFVDAVTISRVALADAGFEQVAVGAGNYQYDPAGSPWAFTGGAGISGNDSGFTAGNPAAPEGGQVAFLQRTGSMSQAIGGWAAGSYVVSFDAAQRGNWQESAQDIEILVDYVVVGIFTPADTSYQRYITGAFTVTEGTHTITFKGLDSAGGDNTAFVDAVQIVAS
jgi:hypothetical protein